MEIHWRNPNHIPTPAQLEIEDRLQSMAEGHTDLIDLWIDIDKSNHHKQGEDHVRIRCMARDSEIVVDGEADDVPSALHSAVEAFEREVRKRRERFEDRPKMRPQAPPYMGVVDRLFLDDGYGFIVTEGGEQVYFHRNAVSDGLEFPSLEEGQRVGLDLEPGEKGPQATVVVPPPPGTPD